ncbi:MAG: CheY-like chemotaxis protein [Kiritimatiellia bacterium]
MQPESQLGKGSRFFFDVEVPILIDKEIKPPWATARPLQVLVADDNESARTVIGRMCESLGWVAEFAASGEEAVELVRARADAGSPFEACIVDWQMRGINGGETCERIREIVPDSLAPKQVILTAHGGEVRVVQDGPGQTAFSGVLSKPVTASMLFDAITGLRDDQGQEHLSPQAPCNEKRLTGLRILVVEDNEINQQVARELLQSVGAVVEVAADGKRGVDAALGAVPPFDAVLMDLQMPVMDGLTATRRLRKETRLQQMPIIAMTANAMLSDRKDCLDAGMNDHVGKPFKFDHLVDVLLRWTGRADVAGLAADSRSTQLSAVEQAALDAGVDLPTALRRLAGKRDVYQRILRIFLRDLAAMSLDLTMMLQADDLLSVMRTLHTLKGTAATLGAAGLASDAERAEDLFNEGVEDCGFRSAVAKTQEAIMAALPGITSLVAALDGAAAPVRPDDMDPGTFGEV